MLLYLYLYLRLDGQHDVLVIYPYKCLLNLSKYTSSRYKQCWGNYFYYVRI